MKATVMAAAVTLAIFSDWMLRDAPELLFRHACWQQEFRFHEYGVRQGARQTDRPDVTEAATSSVGRPGCHGVRQSGAAQQDAPKSISARLRSATMAIVYLARLGRLRKSKRPATTVVLRICCAMEILFNAYDVAVHVCRQGAG